jgi:hypothetical protein
MDFITAELAKGNSVIEILLDFKGAFDTVPHRRLLLKLPAYGIKGKILSWIKAFLTNRKQRVILEDCTSEWVEVLSGVPQGSVLGPLLFVIFINDLPDVVRNVIKLYADDSKILSVVNSQADQILLQKDLDRIVEWCATWLMFLSVRKCKVIKFGSKPNQYEFTIHDRQTDAVHVLEASNVERDLGVLISSDLKWKHQVEAVAARANRILGMLKNTFQHKSVDLWKKLYTVYVRPHLEFAIAVWNPNRIGDASLLEKVQRRATKVPTSLRNLSYEERLVAFGLTKLEKRRERGDLIQLFKILHGYEEVAWHHPPELLRPEQRIGPAAATRGHSKRLRKQEFKAKNRNDNFAAVNNRLHFLTNRIARAWNGLPNEAVNAKSVNSFKATIDKLQ